MQVFNEPEQAGLPRRSSDELLPVSILYLMLLLFPVHPGVSLNYYISEIISKSIA